MPAGKVGLREHDVILRVNGQMIEGEDQLRRMLRESSPGHAASRSSSVATASRSA